LAARRKRNPPPLTRKTDAPGWSAIETVAYLRLLLRTVTRRLPSVSTW
jgi:hypothetical protein